MVYIVLDPLEKIIQFFRSLIFTGREIDNQSSLGYAEQMDIQN